MTEDFYDDQTPEEPVSKKDRKQDVLSHTIRNSMKTVQGRAMMWHFLSQAGIFNTTFSPDPYIHAYQSGRRDQGNRMLTDLRDASEDYYYLMLRENS